MVDRLSLATVLAVSAAMVSGCGQRQCVDAQGRPIASTSCRSGGGGAYGAHWVGRGSGGGDSASTVSRGGFGGFGGHGGGGE